MAVDVKYHDEGGFLEVILSGLFSLDEVVDALGVIVNSNEWPPNVNVIWDGRAVDLEHTDRRVFEDLADFRSNIDLLRRDSRSAVVVSAQSKDVSAHLAKLFSERYMVGDIRVFLDWEEAVRWILRAGGPEAPDTVPAGDAVEPGDRCRPPRR
ncbi:hypothetical protein [Roseospira visakhapatnamensis]|uniref:SpoIIAA-like protein n=1 Tax=Roseospira visakhapatnamensis TaxID=390880 RepID=A0A7W6RDR8_9PROT|nr:hypothetical protein [Roseospira visakhapatnamensis]MBB4266144.1 hypothetical protein [Roseospira visakhapatnamensis]